jgi:isoprenylcysteine carboxyl methyltransferase (ICMT) family protein YpbQ
MLTLSFILPLASVLAIYVVRLIELGTKRDIIAGKIHENLTLRLFLLAGTIIFVGSIVEFIALRPSLRWVPFLAGWVCGIASFAIRRRAIAALGKFWSLHVDNHEFVQSGPFRFVRHPAYFSMILELLALALICNAFFTLLLIPIFFVPVLIMRIRIEEVALVEKFGDAYRTFQRTKPALIPWKW